MIHTNKRFPETDKDQSQPIPPPKVMKRGLPFSSAGQVQTSETRPICLYRLVGKPCKIKSFCISNKKKTKSFRLHWARLDDWEPFIQPPPKFELSASQVWNPQHPTCPRAQRAVWDTVLTTPCPLYAGFHLLTEVSVNRWESTIWFLTSF